MFGHKERKNPLKREPLAKLEDIRDDCIALFINSGMTQRQIHAAGGPTPQTISKWLYKETRFPRFDTIRAFMIALDADLVVVPYKRAQEIRGEAPIAERLGLSISVDQQPKMPKRPKKKVRENATA